MAQPACHPAPVNRGGSDETRPETTRKVAIIVVGPPGIAVGKNCITQTLTMSPSLIKTVPSAATGCSTRINPIPACTKHSHPIAQGGRQSSWPKPVVISKASPVRKGFRDCPPVNQPVTMQQYTTRCKSLRVTIWSIHSTDSPQGGGHHTFDMFLFSTKPGQYS